MQKRRSLRNDVEEFNAVRGTQYRLPFFNKRAHFKAYARAWNSTYHYYQELEYLFYKISRRHGFFWSLEFILLELYDLLVFSKSKRHIDEVRYTILDLLRSFDATLANGAASP